MLLKFLSLLCFICITICSLGQNREDSLIYDNINTTYLEHLIKEEVDLVRNKHKCKSLINDSILFVSSKHHANYLKINKRLSHYENEYPQFQSPQLRVKYYGGTNYIVGENCLKTPYLTIIENKKGKREHLYTYGDLAKSIVTGWVNSPGHFKNMITSEWQVAGLSIAIDTNKRVIYAVQKFATIPYKYNFVESKVLFPYSTYSPPRTVNSFDSIPSIPHTHKHEWGLLAPTSETCKNCNIITASPPPISLYYKKKSFHLLVDDSLYVKNLLKNRKDGFAVEIVEFDDYFCGNPDYFTKPSRRNKQCMLNGRVVEPKYRNDLYTGFKKRKTKKEVKFVSYIFSADSVPFLKRFARYRFDNFSCKYFKANLGRLPKGISNYWNYNLLYIQNNEVCHVDYFTSYCGELYFDEVRTKIFPPPITGDYTFTPDSLKLQFTIPFEKNKYEFSREDIAPFLKSVDTLSYSIDSLIIKAYSSVEGDSAKNDKLQHNRMNSILHALNSRQIDTIKSDFSVSDSWDFFYTQLQKSPRWRGLSALKKEKLRETINERFSDSLEYMLSKQRKADISLKLKLPVDSTNRVYYIKKENRSLNDSIAKYKRLRKDNQVYFYLKKIDKLYEYTHRMAMEGKIDTATFFSFTLPPASTDYPKILEKAVWYSFQFKDALSHYDYINKYLKFLIRSHINKKTQLDPLFVYNYCQLEYQKMKEKQDYSIDKIESLFKLLEECKAIYFQNEEIKSELSNLVYNLHMLLLNHSYASEPEEQRGNAKKTLSYVGSYLYHNNLMTDSTTLSFAKIAVYYRINSLAVEVLRPILERGNASEDIIEFYTKITYRHISSDSNQIYYNWLLSLLDEIDETRWCNLFLGECGIPFQAFDHERLRNEFCRRCMDENEFIIQLKGE